jgi:hypothetical protein
MNKQKLRTYLNGAVKSRFYKHPELRDNAIKYGDHYLVSDSYSIIKLTSNYDLPVIEHKQLCDMFDDFENNYVTEFTFMTIDEDQEQEPIDENYEINIKLFKKINNVIKGNTFAILRKDNDHTPIIKLENSRTKDIAYMLPAKRY